MSFCPQCGKEALPDARFCIACGKQLIGKMDSGPLKDESLLQSVKQLPESRIQWHLERKDLIYFGKRVIACLIDWSAPAISFIPFYAVIQLIYIFKDRLGPNMANDIVKGFAFGTIGCVIYWISLQHKMMTNEGKSFGRRIMKIHVKYTVKK